MSDPVEIALIAAIVGIVPSIMTYLTNVRVGKIQQDQTDNHESVQKSIEVVRNDVNDKMQQLVNASAEAGEARGRTAGLAEAAKKRKK